MVLGGGRKRFVNNQYNMMQLNLFSENVTVEGGLVEFRDKGNIGVS